MNGNRWFVGFVLVFIVLVFAFQYRLPKKFVWSPTFSRYDEQPFGCALFDSLLRKSLPRGYDVSRKTFPQLAREDSTQRRAYCLLPTTFHSRIQTSRHCSKWRSEAIR